MPRPRLEIADVFRNYGPAYRQANTGHVSLPQLKVISAIEACRTEALGGHVAGCAKCGHHHIAYNSCKNRHCPKCQGPAARDWMEARAEDLLPVEYFHVVFTMPAEIARIAYWNPRAVYGLLFRASAKTVMTIAADPKRLGTKVGMTSVLHTWGSALTHHPHIHMIVPGGGLSVDGTKWVACRLGFFLHVRVLARLFRRLFLDGLRDLHRAGQLTFFGDLDQLAQQDTFTQWLAPFRKTEWVVYAKPPFGGPEAVLAYLSRYTHRVRTDPWGARRQPAPMAASSFARPSQGLSATMVSSLDFPMEVSSLEECLSKTMQRTLSSRGPAARRFRHWQLHLKPGFSSAMKRVASSGSVSAETTHD